MFDRFTDGFCPQCLLDDRQEDMFLNKHDYFECPVCRLQARKGNGIFIILTERGEGRLRSTKASGWILESSLFKSTSPDIFIEHPRPFQSEEDFLGVMQSTK
jgi:hypothetical protein